MSIVRNTVIAGGGHTSDLSQSIVTWANVIVNGTTFTFCEYIVTNETGNPRYERVIDYLANVRPTGHDYYPCHIGSTYGLYDKANHTFTAKTVTAHGTDKPYGVNISDLQWATASGYHDLMGLTAIDGGTQAWVDTEHPATNPFYIIETRTPQGGTVTTKNIPFAFYIDSSVPLPPTKTVIEDSVSVTYTYARGTSVSGFENGALIKGRKPMWNLFADGNPCRTFEHSYVDTESVTRYKLRYSILDSNTTGGKIHLDKWKGYNPSAIYPPFAEFANNNIWPIEYHNGVYAVCSNKLYTGVDDDSRSIFLYDDTISNLPELHMALGNIISWDDTIGNSDKIGIYLIHANVYAILSPYFTEQLADTYRLFYDGSIDSLTVPAGKFGSTTPAETKKRAREGKNTDNSWFNWTKTAKVRVVPALYNVLLNADEYNVEGVAKVEPLADTGHYIELDELLLNTPLVIHGDFNKVLNSSPTFTASNFRMILRTPTINFGSTTYSIQNGIYTNPIDDFPSRFYWPQTVTYTKSGIGMTFLCYDSANEVVALNTNDCICTMELTSCDENGVIVGYQVMVKHPSKGIYHKQDGDPYTAGYHDPDIDYRDSPLTYTSTASFTPELLCAAKLSATRTLYNTATEGTYEDKEKAHTYKVCFFYDDFNNFSDNMTVDAFGNTILSPNTTAVMGVYADKAALLVQSGNNPFSATFDGTTYPSATVGGYDSIASYIFNIGTNNHQLMVYPYEPVLSKSSAVATKIYFKRYTMGYGSIDGTEATPNASYPVKYVLMARYRHAPSDYIGAAYFVPDGANKWKLDNTTLNPERVLLNSGVYSLYAKLTYHPTMPDKCFPIPNNQLDDAGVFELEMWSDNIPNLNIIDWSLQRYV